MPTAAGGDRLMRNLGDYDRSFGVEFPCTASCNDDWVHPTSTPRLAEQARSDGWSHEDYLAAVLSREVTARESSRTQNRIRLAGFRRENHWRSPTSTINRHSVERWWHIWELKSS